MEENRSRLTAKPSETIDLNRREKQLVGRVQGIFQGHGRSQIIRPATLNH
jgi:hypothetical protein